MTSYRSSASFGKRHEYIAVAKLLCLGYDVYMTLVDDQQIDCIVRTERNGKPKYFDIQIKARSKEAKQPGTFSNLELVNPRDNYLYIFYSEKADMYWIIPSLDIKDNRLGNSLKSGKNRGNYRLQLVNVSSKTGKAAPRPKFKKYENAFNLIR